MTASKNNSFYSYKTLLSYMNCFDPSGNGDFATFQTDAKVKLIITIPGVAVCGLDTPPPYAYYKTPNTAMMNAFTSTITSLKELGADIPDTLANFSQANNIINLDGDDTPPCPETAESVEIESGMDIVASAMIASGCPTEFWTSKYSLLGVLSLIQTKAQSKDSDEKWIFSLSWGTYGLCDYLATDIKHEIGIGQTCDSITLGCPSGTSAPCKLTNEEYIKACEAILQDLTENHNCIFFVSSGDTGAVSNDNFTKIPYFVDYPTSSKYVISVGGINYTAQAPSDQQTSNPAAYNLVNGLIESGLGTVQQIMAKFYGGIAALKALLSGGTSSTTVGIATPMDGTSRTTTTPDMVIGGQSEATVSSTGDTFMATGGGFSGYNSNDTVSITARASQIDCLNTYYNSVGMPSDFSSSLPWNKDAPQRGIPDLSAAMANGFGITWGDSSSNGDTYVIDNADGTSFSSPLMAGFFALLLSYKDLPSGMHLADFIYENKDCFDKPQTADANAWIYVDAQGKTQPVAGFMSTTDAGTWDPCVGLGVPNFIALYNKLNAS
jgi:hypothetical protein